MRQPTWHHYIGVLALAGVAYLIVFTSSTHTPRAANIRAPDTPPRPNPPPPVREDLPQPPPADPQDEPQLVNTPLDQAIVRGLYPEWEDDGRWYFPGSAEEQQFQQRVAERKRAAEAAGGNTPAAFPLYLRLITAKSRLWRIWDFAILSRVAQIHGDRSAFRKPAVDRLNDPDLNVGKAAMKLLVQIATPEDVPAVVARFVTIEYDDRIVPRDHAYFAEGLKILAKFGGAAEIAVLDKAKAEHLLHNDDKFWAKAEECKKAIRERLAKEKEKDDKK